METVKLFSYIGNVVLLINVILYCTGFARYNKAYKIFTAYLVLIGVIQMVSEIHASYGLNNHFMATYYLFMPFIFLSWFFHQLLSGISPIKSKIIAYVSILITAALFLQYAYNPGLYFKFHSIGFLVTSAILIVYTLFYFYERLTHTLPLVYIVSGIFVYLISSAMIFASIDLIVFHSEISYLVWKINAILFVAYQLLILWEWIQGRIQKSMQ